MPTNTEPRKPLDRGEWKPPVTDNSAAYSIMDTFAVAMIHCRRAKERYYRHARHFGEKDRKKLGEYIGRAEEEFQSIFDDLLDEE